LLALVEGGELHQHLPEDRPGGREHAGSVRHGVRVERGSKLAGALGLEEHEVVSRHHQAVAAVAGPWRVCARDDEGLIEAIEHTSRGFVLGVQWHPELGHAGGADERLLRAFVAAARPTAPIPA